MKQLEPTLAELYFEQFRKEFAHYNVWIEGNEMTFRYLSKIVTLESANHARRIIEMNHLPLRVEVIIQKKVASLPHLLKIIYEPTPS
jgi:hypothetical protein